MGSFVWHVRQGSLEGPELASAYRYRPFSVDEPHIVGRAVRASSEHDLG